MTYRYRLIPVQLWRRGIIESWLNEQAQGGLSLKKMNGFLATFEEIEPQSLEYRIVHTKEKYTSPPTIEFEGWEYVTSYQYDHIFRSKQADATAELQPLAQQATSFQPLLKRERNQLLLSLIGIIGVFILIWAIFYKKEQPIHYLIEGSAFASLVVIVPNTIFTLVYVRNYIKIRRIIRRLKQGISFDYRAGWRLPQFIALFSRVGYIAFVISFMIVLYNQMSYWEYEKLESEKSDEPVLRLHMLENMPAERAFIDNPYNSLEKDKSFLAPMQYHVWEVLEVESGYSPELNFYAMDCLTESIARALFNETKDYQHTFEGHVLDVNRATDFDEVYVKQRASNWFHILTRKGEHVQFTYYQGRADVDTILHALENL